MKCNICGQEFGSGAYCQHCKADRITALGNYAGYTSPNAAAKATNDSVVNAGSTTCPTKQYDKNNFMVCYNCANVIPVDSEYCPCCNTELFKICPKCGHKYSSQYEICNKCGTNRKEYLKEQDELKRRQQEEERKRQQEEERKRQYREMHNAYKRKERISNISLYIVYVGCSLLIVFGTFGEGWNLWVNILISLIIATIMFKFLEG